MSKPLKSIDWFRNGKKIKPDKRTKITVDGTVHKLILTQTKVDDTSEFTAKIPDDTTSAKLTVEGTLPTVLCVSYRSQSHLRSFLLRVVL